jgi:hypothetical protein
MPNALRTLIYKRTHIGDPDVLGRFGIRGCMGRIRGWAFDAVIGVGGMGDEPTGHGIAGRVTWIGIGPHRSLARDARGPMVTFDHFILFDRKGPLFNQLAPKLANRIYLNNIRATMTLVSAIEQREVAKLLRLAREAPPSAARDEATRTTSGKRRARCPPVVREC